VRGENAGKRSDVLDTPTDSKNHRSRPGCQCYLTSTTNKEVATSLAQSVPPSVRGLYTATTVLTELAPLLMRIISPNLKPVRSSPPRPLA
jgi:hypothetical protein